MDRNLFGIDDSRGALGRLIRERGFRFDKLCVTGIDNEPVFRLNAPSMRAEEICLLHDTTPNGDAYVAALLQRITAASCGRSPLPVARFADGEYSFYRLSLKCNGLYKQAESVAAIRRALPLHEERLRYVAQTGILAPLIFPGNSRRPTGLRRFFVSAKGEDSAVWFLDFLEGLGIELSAANYVPFYAVYACLSSPSFAAAMEGKLVCVVNSHFDADSCRLWFDRAGSRPRLAWVQIPDSYVATRWSSMREKILSAVPRNTDICLVGAGVGALPVCADIAERFSIPALDAGHVLNVMNGLESKSKGPRLFTFLK